MKKEKIEKAGRRPLFWAASLCLLAALTALLFYKYQRKETYLFIGDSYAARLESAGYSTENVTIYAIPGVSAKGLDEGKDAFPEMKPDKVVLFVGINSLAEMKEGAVEIEDEKRLIEDLRERYHAPVYVQKVFPVGKSLAEDRPILKAENVAEYNRLLEDYCSETKGVFFFDPQEGFLDEEGYLLRTEDALHIADGYMKLYYKNIMEAIK